ncbi:hypothetical protein KNE206_52080 [Kitasatospora sp. NE20-6]|uniref:hypothetical protein n=1 Tax=Kitasatospora sp. NE20-6 TaxID=2859066 RepID=UPI0034DBC4C4
MRTRTRPTALARYPARTAAALAAALAAAVLLTGCGTPGPLHDAGPARPIAAHPSPLALWPAAATSAPASPQPTADRPPPEPLPSITAPAGGLGALAASAVLTHDPGLTDLEHRALNGGCTGCVVQPAQYRDLSGDGRPELITAVVMPDRDSGEGQAVLHVYTERGGGIVPVLSVTALAGFTADTVGRDLVVHEPTGPRARTSSTYRWSAVRMAFADRRITSTGPDDGAPACPTAVPEPRRTAPAVKTAAPSARPAAPAATEPPARAEPSAPAVPTATGRR